MKLIVIPTPIGNLEDASFRSIRALKEVDLILAEDTRTSSRLLHHYGIDKPMRSFHLHNEHKQVDSLVSEIHNGRSMALISDAGMPGVSDPGFLLVRACVENDIEVECLPGPSAFLPALVCSALPLDRFCFEGFLPPKKGRKSRLERLAEEERTMVFYEAPHRLVKTLKDFQDFFGEDRRLSLSREISKKFEEHIRGDIAELIARFEENPPKGEMVITVAGQSRKKKDRDER